MWTPTSFKPAFSRPGVTPDIVKQMVEVVEVVRIDEDLTDRLRFKRVAQTMTPEPPPKQRMPKKWLKEIGPKIVSFAG
eukprot:2086387-Amphidinium_carterae.1